MLRYSATLKLKEQGLSLRSIAASTGNSCQKVTEVIDPAFDGAVCQQRFKIGSSSLLMKVIFWN